MKGTASSCTISHRAEKIYPESSRDYLVITTKVVADYSYSTRATGHLYRQNPLVPAKTSSAASPARRPSPQVASSVHTGAGPIRACYNAGCANHRRRASQASALQTHLRMNRRTCARFSPASLTKAACLHLKLADASKKHLCRHKIHAAVFRQQVKAPR